MHGPLAVTFLLVVALQAAAASPVPAKKTDGLDPVWKDVIQVTTWGVAIVGGLIAAGKAISESRANREQRERALEEARETREQRVRELRWRQAQIGSELVDRMMNEALAWKAMEILDWENLEIELSSGERQPLDMSEVVRALRPYRDICTPKEKCVRDAFDALFYYMGRMDKSVSIELTGLDDVSQPISYYIDQMARNRVAYEDYMVSFGFSGALNFARRFPSWATAADQNPGSS